MIRRNTTPGTIRPGTFIAFEGVDGAGKTTAIQVVKAWLESKDVNVITTREPGGTLLAERLRSILLAMRTQEIISHTTNALIFAAARRTHVENVINPALEAGMIVLCDRFALSTRCYQPDAYRLEDIIDIATEGTVPNLTIYLDIDPAKGLDRLSATREKDVFENERIEYLRRRRAIGLEWCAKNPDSSVVINADRDMPAVHNDIIAAIANLFEMGD